MRLKSHASLLESALRRPVCHPLLPVRLSRCNAYRYSSTAADGPQNVAVVGGGIAGLSSAYFIAKEFPKSKITILEGGSETGGWIKSKRVQVPGGDVIFESGPRTLRNSTATAHLVQELGLINDVTYTKYTDPATMNRYIYYPDRLNRLPLKLPSTAEAFALWRSGIFKGITGIPRELMMPRRPHTLDDETVGSFISRRMDKNLAQNLMSALFHGIYAGDIWQLSAKTLFSLPWQLEGRYHSALRGYFLLQGEHQGTATATLAHPYDIESARAMNEEIDLNLEFAKNLSVAATFTFKNGMQQMVVALQDALEKKGNVEIKVNTPVQSTEYDKNTGEVVVTSGEGSSSQTTSYDLVISSLRNASLTPYVAVMTVNLYYPNASLLRQPGFGYLIPQSVPFTQNPERALGVIFDSDAVKGQDSATGTKLTVMLGGHWWNDWAAYPGEHEGLEMAKSVVARHLGITEEPVASHVNLSKDCIPQYTIGYEERLHDFAMGLADEFQGRLRVVGSQFNGVGVNDCITGAWNLARGLRGNGWQEKSVGLEKAMRREEPWRIVEMRDLKYRIKDRV